MVCETKIVADDPDAIAGNQKDSLIVSSSQMWTSNSDAFERKDAKREQVLIREFAGGDDAEVRRIFTEGIMERIPNTAFRGLKHQPHTQIMYAVITGKRPNTLSGEDFSFNTTNVQNMRLCVNDVRHQNTKKPVEE